MSFYGNTIMKLFTESSFGDKISENNALLPLYNNLY